MLRRWTQGCISVVSATIAFGMGISKVRWWFGASIFVHGLCIPFELTRAHAPHCQKSQTDSRTCASSCTSPSPSPLSPTSRNRAAPVRTSRARPSFCPPYPFPQSRPFSRTLTTQGATASPAPASFSTAPATPSARPPSALPSAWVRDSARVWFRAWVCVYHPSTPRPNTPAHAHIQTQKASRSSAP